MLTVIKIKNNHMAKGRFAYEDEILWYLIKY